MSIRAHSCYSRLNFLLCDLCASAVNLLPVFAKSTLLCYTSFCIRPRSSVDRAAASGAVCGRSSRPGGTRT